MRPEDKIENVPVYCPECHNRVIVKVIPDDNSTFIGRLFGKDGWHRVFRCPACNWKGRTPNRRDTLDNNAQVGGERYVSKGDKSNQHRRHHSGHHHKHKHHHR